MKRFNFWRKWLLVMAMVMLGMSFYLLSVGVTGQAPAMVNNVFWPEGNLPAGVGNFQGWIFGANAAVWLALGMMILFLVVYPFKNKEKWTRRCLLSSLWVWFLIDSLFSVLYKNYTNAMGNMILFILLLIPLLATKKAFD